LAVEIAWQLIHEIVPFPLIVGDLWPDGRVRLTDIEIVLRMTQGDQPVELTRHRAVAVQDVNYAKHRLYSFFQPVLFDDPFVVPAGVVFRIGKARKRNRWYL